MKESPWQCRFKTSQYHNKNKSPTEATEGEVRRGGGGEVKRTKANRRKVQRPCLFRPYLQPHSIFRNVMRTPACLCVNARVNHYLISNTHS